MLKKQQSDEEFPEAEDEDVDEEDVDEEDTQMRDTADEAEPDDDDDDDADDGMFPHTTSSEAAPSERQAPTYRTAKELMAKQKADVEEVANILQVSKQKGACLDDDRGGWTVMHDNLSLPACVACVCCLRAWCLRLLLVDSPGCCQSFPGVLWLEQRTDDGALLD